MSDLNPRPDPLDRAADALRHAPAPPGPPEELIASTVASLRAPPRRRGRLLRLAAAAALLAAVTAALLWPARPTAASPFRRGMARAAAARTMTARMITNPGPGASVHRVFMRGLQNRIEVPNGGWAGAPPADQVPVIAASVNDLEARRTLSLDFVERTYSTVGLNFEGRGPDLLAQLWRVRDDAARSLGEEPVDGRPARAYAVALDGLIGGHPRSEVKVWLDAATDLPVRIQADDRHGAHARTTVYDEIVWGAPLPDELFRTTPPPGFREVPFRSPVPAPKRND